MEFIKKCFSYLVEHKALGITACALAAVILIAIIALIVKGVKNRKSNKKAKAVKTAKTAKVTEKPATVVTQTAPAPVSQEEKERLRQETLARLAREEEEAAEEERALKKAQEQAEKKAAAKKPVEKKPVEKKQTAKKPAPKKEENLYEAIAAAPIKPDLEDESEVEKASKYSGKWSIYRVITGQENEEETYFFELHASNGEKLLSSEEYTSYNGALRGIETHKTNIEKGNFKITISKKGDFIFKLLSGKNLLLCMGENYPTKTRCESAIESTKRFAKTAVLDESVHDLVIKVPVEDDTDTAYDLPSGVGGKWIISSTQGADGESVYYFELFANNGEKLLSSEEYTTYVGAVNGIGTHKANIEKGNFRISLTKRGDYIYKLLNGNGQLLCLGEHYKTKRRCQNAVDSVKRFAKNSPVLADSSLTK